MKIASTARKNDTSSKNGSSAKFFNKDSSVESPTADSLFFAPIAIQRKTTDAGSVPIANPNIESKINQSKGHGQAMDKGTKTAMSNSFGTDFSHVSIHTDETAVQLSQDLGAKAFTTGSDIYFNRGQYDPSSAGGQKLLAHELTHTIQQGSKSTQHIQRDTEQEIVTELETHVPARSRTGNARTTLERFSARIPDIAQFASLAESYGLEPNELLAVFMTEGGFANPLYETPLQTGSTRRLNSAAGLVGFHLWTVHGMDDFALVRPAPGTGDNQFNFAASDGRFRSNILNTLAEFYNLGLLWDASGERPQDPTQQLTPAQIFVQLTSLIDVRAQLPMPGFVLMAIRIQAAMFARRQGLIGRTASQLESLGNSPEVARRFRHRAVDIERARVARQAGFVTDEVSREEQIQWARNHEHDPDFSAALLADPQYVAYIQESYARRTTVEAARISMGTPAFFVTRLGQASRDFRHWINQSQNREALTLWARSMLVNGAIIDGPDSDASSSALQDLRASLTAQNIPSRQVRQALAALANRRNPGERLFAVIEYILNTSEQYAGVATTEDWLAGVLEQRPDRRSILPAVVHLMTPTPRALRDARGGHLRAFGNYLIWAQQVIDARANIANLTAQEPKP